MISELFDLPPSIPKRKRRREVVEACKRQHGIETMRHPALSVDEDPWTAIHRSSCERIGCGYGVLPGMSIPEMVARVGRLLMEADVIAEGRTEREAVKSLCDGLKLECRL